MKKLILIMTFLTMTLPATAACKVTGNACAYSIDNPAIQDKYLPDNINNIQKPDAFRPHYIAPYRDALINTETGATATQNQNNYNSNCQFGVCLPGVNGEEFGVIE